VTGQWFSPGIPVSSTSKADRHNIAEIWLKVALNTTNQNFCVNLLFSVVPYFMKLINLLLAI
jgi:hypothetical protein